MSPFELNVQTQLPIARSPGEIFEAIVNPEQMAHYFITSGNARLDAGKPVTWTWEDHGAELVIAPGEIVPDQKISFQWEATGKATLVVIDLEPLADGWTMVHVRDGSVAKDDAGIASALQQMQGWMNMLCCLKAWLEHGIHLRTSPG